MSIPVAEASERHEELFQTERVLEWLTYAGNDERKLATMLAVSVAGEPLSKTGIYRQVESLGGDSPVPGDLGSPFQFCEDSLEKIGAVRQAPAEVLALGKYPKTVTGFETTSDALELGVPFAGALLEWSERHIDTPNISLSILGQSGGGGKYELRAPLVRFWTLYDLATVPDEGQPFSPSIGYLAQHVPVQSTTRSSTVEQLERHGLVEAEVMHRENTRQFQILNPDYVQGPRKRPFENLIPSTQMLYRTFKVAYEIKPQWGQDEFFELMVALNPDIENEVIKKAKSYMAQALSPSSTNLQSVVKEIGGQQHDGYSKVTLRPEAATAIQELVSIVDGFCVGDNGVINAGRVAAERIINSPGEFSALYLRGHEQSSLTSRDRAIEQNLLQLFENSGGGVSAQQARELYAQKTGREVTVGAIRRRLGAMVTAGQLTVQTGIHSKVKQRQEAHYKLAEN